VSESADQAWLGLAQEALRKSSVLWLSLPGADQPRIAWHVWHDGAVYVVHGGAEQSLPGLDQLAMVEFSVRSKDKGTLLVRGMARSQTVPAGDRRWPAAVAALHAHRQSPPDGADQPARWATASTLTRLDPSVPSGP
jgi:hypothetical protein